jgi:acyl-CoA thioesterase FadM
MIILLRLLWVVLLGLHRPRLGVADVSRLSMLVWLVDLDLNLHMNNGRYLALMDLGRGDWMIRSGAWRLIRRERMTPVVAGCMVRYRRSLRPLQRFELRTRLLGWDQRWVYVEQVMESNEGVACLAVVRTGFLRDGHLVSPAEMVQKLNVTSVPPALPDWVADWTRNEAAFANGAMNDRAAEP